MNNLFFFLFEKLLERLEKCSLQITGMKENHTSNLMIRKQQVTLNNFAYNVLQGRETIEVVLKLPALRLSSLLAAMELEEDTKISIPAPFSNLPKILTGRSLIPLPPNNGEQDQNSSSNERTITSGPSSSSSPSELPHISNAAPALFLRIGSWQACK